MKDLFVPYTQALELKELGFDEPCLGSWNFYTREINFNGQPSTFSSEDVIQLPTFSQAFEFFREKYNLKEQYGVFPHHTLMFNYVMEGGKEEEAELACLKKLIEIIKIKNYELHRNSK